MKIIFFGLGQIGKRHLRLLQKHFDFDVYAFRSGHGHARYDTFDNVIEIRTWHDVDKIKPDVAFITNPTYLHIPTALECAKRGMKLFIEKPIGHNLELLDDLLLASKNLVTYIAYPLRHIPKITELIHAISAGCQKIYHAQFTCLSFLPDWRAYITYSAYKDQGGGAILDLSHEIDLATLLCGDIESIVGMFDKQSSFVWDIEDYADMIIKHTYGGVSNIHVNLFTKSRARWFEIITDHYDRISVSIVGPKSIESSIDDSTYLRQLQYFFDHIDDTRMMNNIHDASDMFRKVIQWKENYERCNQLSSYENA